MELEFSKLHGLGNDFVVVDDRARTIELTEAQVQYLCDRHVGVGADGVILVRPSDNPACAAYMHYINADGTLAQMCGNGVRCFAKFLVDRGLVPLDARKLVADTLSGPKSISFEIDGTGKLMCATVDMGVPRFDPMAVPVRAATNAMSVQGAKYVRDVPLASPWGTFRFTCVSMGNPHAVCFVDDWNALVDELFVNPCNKCLATLDVNRIGAFFEAHELFPEKTNVEFATVESRGLAMRVYERGCGETLACGTGACAVQVAALLTERAGCENDVVLRGGILHVAWGDDGHIRMTGPAKESFKGKVVVA